MKSEMLVEVVMATQENSTPLFEEEVQEGLVGAEGDGHLQCHCGR